MLTNFWATVCKTVRPMLSDHCLSCLSVMLVYCCQMVGRIKMKLGMQVGLNPGCNVLDGSSSPPQKRGQSPPNFWPISVVAKWASWMDQDATGYESMGHIPGDFVLDREPTQFPPPQKGLNPPPQFLAHVYYGQAAGWIKIALGMEVGLGPGHTVLDGDPTPLPKGAHPQFSTHVCHSQPAAWIKMPLGTEVGVGLGHITYT